jgi:hypothetical protein
MKHMSTPPSTVAGLSAPGMKSSSALQHGTKASQRSNSVDNSTRLYFFS